MSFNYTEPVPMTGWRAWWRWLVCRLTMHSETCSYTDVEQYTPTMKRAVTTAWCGQCGRPVTARERSRCNSCSAKIDYWQHDEW